MSQNTSSQPRGQDLRTNAIVLRRTKYGEADRILSLLTPHGKQEVIAKGVRKEKSKLAGGIEMFSVSEVTIHHSTKDERLGILTSAKMLKFYSQILADLSRLELASTALKQANRLADDIKDSKLFSIINQALAGLHQNYPLDLVESFLLLNLAELSGEAVNLMLDTTGNKLTPDKQYVWNSLDNALEPNDNGPVGEDEIKLLRLLLATPLSTAAQVQGLEKFLSTVLTVARAIAQK